MKILSQLLIYSLILLFTQQICAQKYITKTGHAYFMSHTDAIDIDANNNQVAAIADTETGDMVVIILIKAFEFTLATADKHFNETYMESDEFPKAMFKGNIDVLQNLDPAKNAEYDAVATGKLTIHGKTREITQPGKLIVEDGVITMTSAFNVQIADYDIKVPKSVEERVAKEVDVKINLTLHAK